MAKKKELKILTIFKILLNGIKFYIQNLDKFLAYMTFPVLGQIAGIALIFTVIHLYSANIENLVAISPIFDNIPLMLILLLLFIAPGFMLFFAAFWKYMVAYGALNSMANNLNSGAKLEDLSIHNDTVTRRTPTFLGILLILSVIGMFGLSLPFLFIILILMIYLCLVFQIFAFEENLTVLEIFKKSFQMIKGNFAKAAILMIFLFLLTYLLIPSIFVLAFDQLSLFDFLAKPINAFCQNLPLDDIQNSVQTVLTAWNSVANTSYDFVIDIDKLSRDLAIEIISLGIIGYLLPLRSICCTILYKDLEIKKLKSKKLEEL